LYILLTDETNRRPSADSRFFIYGGLLFKVDKLPEIDSAIEKIRQRLHYKPSDHLKFDSNSRPNGVSFDDFVQAKREVIDLCLATGCKFIVHIIHHDIIRNQDPDQHIQWAADYVIGRFNYFLDSEAKDYGICVVDSLPVKAQFKYLSDKFSLGLTLASGKETRLQRIKLFASTTINASHANSVMDIVLGSFRYCINNPKNKDAARHMIGKVVDLMWHTKVGDTYYVHDKGLIVRPEKIKSPSIKAEYDALFAHINELLDSKSDSKTSSPEPEKANDSQKHSG
jgi:hypothetical protein